MVDLTIKSNKHYNRNIAEKDNLCTLERYILFAFLPLVCPSQLRCRRDGGGDEGEGERKTEHCTKEKNTKKSVV
ncbi:MAG TPA: hypothetical protein PLQ41_00285 [bacterium]|nr:hypothetical protein [bacterium]HPP29814.1 hypothetical protein [bacterium]